MNIAMIDLLERRRETPAWWQASFEASVAEAQQIERESAREVKLGRELVAARPEAAAEFIAEPDHR